MSELTAQEVFDTTVRHLRTMKRQSRIGDKCAYRGYDGSKCALGCHLTDEEVLIPAEHRIRHAYGHEIETLDQLPDSSAEALVELRIMPERLIPHEDLLVSLQSIHDGSWNWQTEGGIDVSRVRERLSHVAYEYDLNIKIVSELY